MNVTTIRLSDDDNGKNDKLKLRIADPFCYGSNIFSAIPLSLFLHFSIKFLKNNSWITSALQIFPIGKGSCREPSSLIRASIHVCEGKFHL
jgi:hypothetical protein